MVEALQPGIAGLEPYQQVIVHQLEIFLVEGIVHQEVVPRDNAFQVACTPKFIFIVKISL
jgi:hypothetical protein